MPRGLLSFRPGRFVALIVKPALLALYFGGSPKTHRNPSVVNLVKEPGLAPEPSVPQTLVLLLTPHLDSTLGLYHLLPKMSTLDLPDFRIRFYGYPSL